MAQQRSTLSEALPEYGHLYQLPTDQRPTVPGIGKAIARKRLTDGRMYVIAVSPGTRPMYIVYQVDTEYNRIGDGEFFYSLFSATQQLMNA